MRRRNSGLGQIILIVIFAAIIFVLVISFVPKGPKPPVDIECSLDPLTITQNERSLLTISIENLDLKTHEIKFVFDASSRISIYAGTERLLEQNTYAFTLDATNPSERKAFTMSGSLDQKVSSAQYPILLKVYVNGNELAKNWDDLLLTVRR